MFSASWRVYSEVPELFDGFLRPFFLIPQEPSQSLPGLYNKRACWAMAEMFISYLLTSRHTGEFDTKFLQYCLRIYHNLRRAGQFADFAEGNLVSGRENSFGIGADQPWCNPFLDPAIVKQYGRDDEISSEMDTCEAPDRQTEEILQDMRTQLHREAERKWHKKAAEIFDGKPSLRGPSLSRTPSSAPPPQSGRRVTFPYEPTMTESSVSGSRNRRYNRNTDTPYGEARGRSISRSASTSQPTTSTSHAHGKWRFPNDPSKDLAISPLRITSPGGTITTTSTSGASTVARPVYNRPGNWLRRDPDHYRTKDLRSMYGEPVKRDDHSYQPRERSYERTSYGQAQRQRSSSMASKDPTSTFYHREITAAEVPRSSSRRWNGTERAREPVRTPSRSPSMSGRGEPGTRDSHSRRPRISRNDRDPRPPLAYTRHRTSRELHRGIPDPRGL
ncbi:uncharacterized protein RCO7_08939 [Rhynchosporium graminicola]|uniref:Uncharacterized protein n=1 Tax=Rhynchosporium graminicola TaxID=2792576 RepID=A0A1E1KJS6_9HELO|nr:uncharacterized protein RCO7_08939 [Rhynchosporium commune]